MMRRLFCAALLALLPTLSHCQIQKPEEQHIPSHYVYTHSWDYAAPDGNGTIHCDETGTLDFYSDGTYADTALQHHYLRTKVRESEGWRAETAESETYQFDFMYYCQGRWRVENGKFLFCELAEGFDMVLQNDSADQWTAYYADLIEKAAEAGLRSVFLGFETFSPENLRSSNKLQNLSKDYVAAVERLHSLGIMINGSFVFGLDHDDKDVFRRTVEWGIEHSITTATFHILTPYPGTRLFQQMQQEGRITSYDWSKYDTRTVVYKTVGLTADELKQGYDWAYKEFYRWNNIFRASFGHDNLKQQLAHLFYMGGWKKFEPFWNFMIRYGHLNRMLPVLEQLLANTRRQKASRPSLAKTALGKVAF